MSDTGLIMAGGRSERMRAGGIGDHKGLRKVGGIPLIECNVRALLRFGIDRIFVAVNRREAALLQWVQEHGLQLLVEDQPLGTIGAVASLPRDVDDVVVVNVDNLTSLDLRAFVAFHRERRAAATIASHRHSFPMPFGMLELDGSRVVAYREKPKLPVTISSGLYALSRRAIDRVRPGMRLDAPSLMEDLLRAGDTVVAYTHDAAWIDVNDEAALLDAERLFRAEAER